MGKQEERRRRWNCSVVASAVNPVPFDASCWRKRYSDELRKGDCGSACARVSFLFFFEKLQKTYLYHMGFTYPPISNFVSINHMSTNVLSFHLSLTSLFLN
jgi:hypothetical protein